jgi:hypothetical protein
MVWSCHLCNKKQELLAKTGAWYHGGMARPVVLEVGANSGPGAASGQRPTGRQGMEASPSLEKKAKLGAAEGASGSEKDISSTGYERQRSFTRASSLQGRELKRQYSVDSSQRQANQDGAASQGAGGQGSDLAGGGGGGGGGGTVIGPDGEKLAAGSERQGRGRDRDRTPAKHRFHSESRLSETDKRYVQVLPPHPNDPRHRDAQERELRAQDRERERGERERERGERERGSDRDSSVRGSDRDVRDRDRGSHGSDRGSDRERGDRHSGSRSSRDPGLEPGSGGHRSEDRRMDKEGRESRHR